MKKILKSIGCFLIFVSFFGGCTSCLNSVGSVFDGEPTGSGGVSEIHRNSSFFNSDNELLNSILVLPRWFNQVSEEEYYGNFGSDTGYKDFNQSIGLISLLLLFVAIFYALSFVENREKVDIKFYQHKWFRITFVTIAWLYILYWVIPTLWIVYQWTNGIRMMETSVWY